MTQTMDAIAQIHQTITATALEMEYLTQTAQQISGSLNSTNTLVTQVNQQVMNVAISSGRSKEVSQETVMSIAETVRSLTQEFAQMSKNIDSLVAKVCCEANNMALAMTTTTEQVVAGTQLTQQTPSITNGTPTEVYSNCLYGYTPSRKDEVRNLSLKA